MAWFQRRSGATAGLLLVTLAGGLGVAAFKLPFWGDIHLGILVWAEGEKVAVY